MYRIGMKEFAEEFSLIQLAAGVDAGAKTISQAKLNRPALQLTGFFDYFDAQRLQIIGMVEHTYLDKMDARQRDEVVLRLFECGIPGIVFCRGLVPHPEFLRYAAKFGTPIFSTSETTTDFIGEVIRWLKVQLAPRITLHGVLVDVYGEGLLIMGESGIGKSEMALELIKRGHRFVADDAVEIKKVSGQTLIGSCPEITRFFLEVRGIGIIDVLRMFGIQAVKEIQNIDLVMKLEMWDNSKAYDRMGLDDEHIDILGNHVLCQTVPIRPGRNMAMIGESAAINHRQKKMGYHAAQALSQRLESKLKG